MYFTLEITKEKKLSHKVVTGIKIILRLSQCLPVKVLNWPKPSLFCHLENGINQKSAHMRTKCFLYLYHTTVVILCSKDVCCTQLHSIKCTFCQILPHCDGPGRALFSGSPVFFNTNPECLNSSKSIIVAFLKETIKIEIILYCSEIF